MQGKPGPFLPKPKPPKLRSDEQHGGQNKMGKQDEEDIIDEEEQQQKPVNFPPRKRSIPYGKYVGI